MGNSCAGPQEKQVAQETLDFIVAKTNATKEDVEEQYNNFLAEYPDGKINKKSFIKIINDCKKLTENEPNLVTREGEEIVLVGDIHG